MRMHACVHLHIPKMSMPSEGIHTHTYTHLKWDVTEGEEEALHGAGRKFSKVNVMHVLLYRHSIRAPFPEFQISTASALLRRRAS